jgi:hypothetical protein
MIDRFKFSFLSHFKSEYSRSLFMNYSKYFDSINECNICGESNHQVISERDKFGCYYPLMYCLNCHNIFSTISLKKDMLNNYYDGIANKIKIVKDPKLLFQNRIKPSGYAFARYKFISSSLKEELKDNTLICEIGCSDGANLFPFHVNKYETIGFDFNSKRTKIGNEKGLNLYKVSSESKIFEEIINEPRHKLIYLSHLIEHIVNIHEFFKKLIESMSIGDLLFIETPCVDYTLDFDSPSSDLYPKDNNFINHLQLEHTYFFQKNQLNNILKLFGFKELISNNVYRGLFTLESKNFPDRSFFIQNISKSKPPSILNQLDLLEEKYKNETNNIKLFFKHIF